MSDVFFQRLESLREIKGFRQYEMAEYMGITPSTYSSYKKDGTEPGLSTISRLAEKLNAAELYYLLTGEKPDTIILTKGKEREECDLIGSYRASSPDEQTGLLMMLRARQTKKEGETSKLNNVSRKNSPSKKPE